MNKVINLSSPLIKEIKECIHLSDLISVIESYDEEAGAHVQELLEREEVDIEWEDDNELYLVEEEELLENLD